MNNRIAQVYGYAVCLHHSHRDAHRDQVGGRFRIRSERSNSRGGRQVRSGTPALTSFELYKISRNVVDSTRRWRVISNARRGVPVRRRQHQASSGRHPSPTPSLRRRYDAEREAVIGNARFRATRSLVGNFLLIVLAAVLFVVHWRWLRSALTRARSDVRHAHDRDDGHTLKRRR